MFGVVKIEFDPTTIDPCFVKVLALLLGVGCPQASTGRGALDEFVGCGAWNSPMTKRGDDTLPCNVAQTRSTVRTGKALPSGRVGGTMGTQRHIEVTGFKAIFGDEPLFTWGRPFATFSIFMKSTHSNVKDGGF